MDDGVLELEEEPDGAEPDDELLDELSLVSIFAAVPVDEPLDDEPARLADDVRDLARRAFALLEHGLGDYAVKPPA